MQTATHRKPTVHHVREGLGGPRVVYIGRSRAGQPTNPLGNPFRMYSEADRPKVIARYRFWLWSQIKSDPGLWLPRLRALEGKQLVCFCSPKPCHGDVLADACVWALQRL